MAKNKDLVPFAGGTEVMPGLNLREMRRSVLIEGGLLSPRQKYASKEERKAASKERSKARREARKTLLEESGISPYRTPKLTKAQRKVKAKGLRRVRNLYLRQHPEEAKKLGIDLSRLRV